MILAIQTAAATTMLWLLDPAAPVSKQPALEWDSGRDLADQLLAKITATLSEAGLQLHDLTGIVVFSGPGSFTSLRIGHTVVNALADSLSIPVAGARGDDWLQAGCQSLADTPVGRPALPHYGSEANITKPKA